MSRGSRRRRRLAIVVAGLLALGCGTLPAQSQPSSSDDVDNMFNGSSGSPPPADTQQPPAQQSPPPASLRPDDIMNDNRLHFFGSIDLYGDLGGGWKTMPDFSQLGSNLGYDVGGSLTASLGFEIRPVPELRIRGKLSYSFPGTSSSAPPQLSEMFMDYSVLQTVFFRVGIFDYTWGNSQFFLFGNLPSRSVPGWGSATFLSGRRTTSSPRSRRKTTPSPSR